MKFSLIICTYNPPQKRLKDIFNALINLCYPDFEIILVDNNSSNNVPYDIFLFYKNNKKNITVSYIKELNPGLVNARICGFKLATSDWLVYVDDDNELDENYLSQLFKSIEKFPSCGVWGPGDISVNFSDVVHRIIDKNYRYVFQEKKLKEVIFGRERKWNNYHPSGSGMCIRKDVFEIYSEKFLQGKINAVGRKGQNLSSGEDSQIVWTAIDLEFDVGCNPEMKLVHHIPAERANFDYISKLLYHVSYDYYKGYFECFSDEAIFMQKPGIRQKINIFLRAFRNCLPSLLMFRSTLKIEKAWTEGYNKFYNDFKR